MALSMRAALVELNREQETALDLRIGIHTGPLVAGVIGKSKFTYDLWGDTVNTASRMESHSEPGCIQVSAATAQALPEGFTLQARGEIEVKGKGLLECFYLEGAPTEA